MPEKVGTAAGAAGRGRGRRRGRRGGGGAAPAARGGVGRGPRRPGEAAAAAAGLGGGGVRRAVARRRGSGARREEALGGGVGLGGRPRAWRRGCGPVPRGGAGVAAEKCPAGSDVSGSARRCFFLGFRGEGEIRKRRGVYIGIGGARRVQMRCGFRPHDRDQTL